MFHVTRYDPKIEKRKHDVASKNQKKTTKIARRTTKTSHEQNEHDESREKRGSSLRVIAEDQNQVLPVSRTTLLRREDNKNNGNLSSKRLLEEAFDDLDIDVENLIGERVDDFALEDGNNQRNDEPDLFKKKSSGMKEYNDDSEKKKTYEIGVHALSKDDLMTAFRLSQLPLKDAAKELQLASFLVENLQREGCESFFPVQALVIPDVIASERNGHVRVQDLCITAPTGSGKTLAYVLPILNSLGSKITSRTGECSNRRRLQSLIVLPSRDLATQVYTVFESYVVGSDIKVGLVVGQSHFASEQQMLVVDKGSARNKEYLRYRLWFDPGNLDLSINAFEHQALHSKDSFQNTTPPRYGWSNFDILVCTPGRLVDHLDNTPGFTLQHLRYLVVDEADRLLGQSYHSWIDRVMESANSASIDMWKNVKHNNNNQMIPIVEDTKSYSFRLEPITWRRGGMNGDSSHTYNTNDAYDSIAASVCQPVQLRKFLVSATLTKDPRKLASLRLVNAKNFNVHQLNSLANTVDSYGGSNKKYAMPNELEEYLVECTAEQKPIVLLALILDRLTSIGSSSEQNSTRRKQLVVVFTSSVDSTHRLARLLQLLWVAGDYGDMEAIGEFSSSLKQGDRSILLQRANDINSTLSVLVCSDGLSRGMDIRYADTVINYDVPSLAKTYVHRCGRTARAFTKGSSISILKKGRQVTYFQKMRNLILSPDRIRPIKLQKSLVGNVVPMYRQCLLYLKNIIIAEERGELSLTEPIPSEYLQFGDKRQQRSACADDDDNNSNDDENAEYTVS